VRAHCCTNIACRSVDLAINNARLSEAGWSCHQTLRFMQSANTLASAQRFVRGGRMAVEPNIVSRPEYAS